jgi:ABC-type microcin C transport system duplicated ATPase subunit YejF
MQTSGNQHSTVLHEISLEARKNNVLTYGTAQTPVLIVDEPNNRHLTQSVQKDIIELLKTLQQEK